jgi:hypothetical protein
MLQRWAHRVVHVDTAESLVIRLTWVTGRGYYATCLDAAWDIVCYTFRTVMANRIINSVFVIMVLWMICANIAKLIDKNQSIIINGWNVQKCCSFPYVTWTATGWISLSDSLRRWSQWPHGLRCRPWSLGSWDSGFESRLRHGCLSSSNSSSFTCHSINDAIWSSY